MTGVPTSATQAPPPALRLAIAQPPMAWTTGGNTDTVLAMLSAAAAAGAALCVFPELMVTGFHRRIAREAMPSLVGPALQRIAQACADHRIAASVGAPCFGADGAILNSQLLFDRDGQLAATTDKRGLTAPEATFFAPGARRPVVPLAGWRIGCVICREIEDTDNMVAALAPQAPQLLLWPGLMGPEDSDHDDPPGHVRQAQALARRLGTAIVQANWPQSLNDPALSARTGRSVVVGADGGIRQVLPQAAAGLAVLDVAGDSHEWQPWAIAPALAVE